MKYQGHEIKIIRKFGKNATIRRVDGGKFETCSMLPHHRGKKVLADQLSVSLQSIEGYGKRTLKNAVAWKAKATR